MSETTRIGGGGITPAEAQAARGLVEDAQPWRINPWGRTDTAEIADGLAEMRLSDPEGAARVERAVRGQLSATEQHHLSRDLETAQARADRALVLDATQIGIDLVGIVDPTGAADVAGAGLSVYRGDYAGAAISLVGLIPYAGDAAKLAKFGRWSDTVLSVARRAADSAEFADKALPILRRIGDAIDALPQGVLDRMPAGARAKLDEMKAAIGEAVARHSDEGADAAGAARRIDPSPFNGVDLADMKAPVRRHDGTKVTQKSPAKDQNTIYGPGVDVNADVAAIRRGEATRSGETLSVNGRNYGVHPETGRLYPKSGDGLFELDRGAYKALGVLNKFGDTPQAHSILDRMHDVGAPQVEAALNAWRAFQ